MAFITNPTSMLLVDVTWTNHGFGKMNLYMSTANEKLLKTIMYRGKGSDIKWKWFIYSFNLKYYWHVRREKKHQQFFWQCTEFTVVITNSAQQSPPWEANQPSGSQRISNIVETKSSYCAYNSPPHFPILCPKNAIHIIPSYLFRDQFNVILPSCLDLPNASFLKASHQNPLCISVLLHMCHGTQIRKLLIMEFPQLLPISSLCC